VEDNVARRSRRAEASKAIGDAWNGSDLLDWVNQEYRSPSWLAGARQFAFGEMQTELVHLMTRQR
jgi:hypothetical protein